jgi:hypothetical protein
MTYPGAQAVLARLDDQELLHRMRHGMFNDEVRPMALAEIARRGLAAPAGAADEAEGADAADYLGDMVLLVRQLEPTEAHLLAGLLNSMGIAAQAGDTQLVQTHSLWSIALGGANVRVPASQLSEAQAIHAAFVRGDFRLDDNTEADESPGVGP